MGKTAFLLFQIKSNPQECYHYIVHILPVFNLTIDDINNIGSQIKYTASMSWPYTQSPIVVEF